MAGPGGSFGPSASPENPHGYQNNTKSDLRREIEREREKRRELEEKVEHLEQLLVGNLNPEYVLEDLDDEIEHACIYDELVGITDDTATDPTGSIDRSSLLPIHSMALDLHDTTKLDVSQRRAAALFERFMRRLAGESGVNVVSGAQKFFMNSSQARQVLEEEGLLDVSRSSKHKIVSRAMRDVQAFTIVDFDDADEHPCDSIDDCSHGLMQFRTGKPLKLAVSKKKFRAAMENAGAAFEAVLTTADDGENETTSPEDSGNRLEVSRKRESARDEFSRLDAAEVSTDD